MGRKAHPLAARIKKMMQTDEDVGKIAQATPVMIGMGAGATAAVLLPALLGSIHC